METERAVIMRPTIAQKNNKATRPPRTVCIALDPAQHRRERTPYTWIMDRCPYYHEQARGEGAKTQTIPCCRHKHSPVPCRSASLLTGFPHLLSCNGRIGRCQIPPHEQLDIA